MACDSKRAVIAKLMKLLYVYMHVQATEIVKLSGNRGRGPWWP